MTLQRACGRPGAGAYVELLGPENDEPRWRTGCVADEEGRILFDDLPPGPATLRVQQYGFIMTRPLEVALPAGAITRVTVVEERGLPVEVTVVTEEGVPVAGAALEFFPRSSGFNLWLEGEVQRIGFYTDERGRFRLPRAPEGAVGVDARLGSRSTFGTTRAGAPLILRFDELKPSPR